MIKKVILTVICLFHLSNLLAQDFQGNWELKTEYSQNIQVDVVEFYSGESQVILTPVEVISDVLFSDWSGVTNITFGQGNIAQVYSPSLKGRINGTYNVYENQIELENGKSITIIHLTFYQNESFVLALNLTKINDDEYYFTYMIQPGTFGLPFDYPGRINYIGRMVRK